MLPPKERSNYAKVGPNKVFVVMVTHASSLTESTNLYVINQHLEKKYAVIFISISIASSDQDAILSMRLKKLLKSLKQSPSRKWWRNFPNLYLKWGFVKVYYNFCEHKRKLYFLKPNNWFYRPNFLIYIFFLCNYHIFNLYFSAFLLFYAIFAVLKRQAIFNI